MKAIVFETPGSASVLRLQDIPAPTIQTESEVLVRLRAAGVNPIDTKLRSRGTFYPEKTPHVLGCDGAGIVEAVGAAVQSFQVGDEVFFCNGGLGGLMGTYAEFAVVDERFLAIKPAALSFVEAAAAPLVLITAWESLYDRGRLQAGQKVLIQAGAGGVGHVAIQLASLQGAEVCTTVGSQAKAEFVRQLGADLVILYKNTDVVDEVLTWTKGRGVDLAFDTVGGETFYLTVPAVKIYGDLVTILEPDPALGNLKTARMRNLRISLELMLTPMLQGLAEEQQQQAHILQQCAGLCDRNLLKIHVSKTFPLAQAGAAHELLETGSVTGKIVLEIPGH
ncbi:zinc-dependent alcohol dehydrogenase family protein [Tychonema sp. LEGE 07199]|uniref:zinc-dependent alcohol dehydrogenase family protein n=1 Tax=unclassified Tychonema TaxID=2642144 RepID=UPI00187F3255|nr:MULTISPECIES: zinc-dependent alcohol dehydrogenase family protein [unclassified Tychonema]MBE9120455.1 zinc-dependent alcohol dehydrogenase family protein [Tychonema sp. LEGE 07199]MBE9133164.1 zinc-dependent alcohol dehydrogenase family protein [Tychonema sp. LEGE 07196]